MALANKSRRATRVWLQEMSDEIVNVGGAAIDIPRVANPRRTAAAMRTVRSRVLALGGADPFPAGVPAAVTPGVLTKRAAAVDAVVSAATTFEDEALTLFAAMTGPPTNARKILCNAVIKALKTSGAWALLDGLYDLAAHDAQAARLNWKTPGTLTASVVNAPTFTADRGYAGNGTSSYVQTGFNPTVGTPQFAQNDALFSLWIVGAGSPTDTSVPAGGFFNGTQGVTLTPLNIGNVTARINQATSDSKANPSGVPTGLVTVMRLNSASGEIFLNGASLGQFARTSAALVNGTFRIGSVSDSLFSTRQIGVCMFGKQRSAAQELATYQALLAYMQGVGAA